VNINIPHQVYKSGNADEYIKLSEELIKEKDAIQKLDKELAVTQSEIVREARSYPERNYNRACVSEDVARKMAELAEINGFGVKRYREKLKRIDELEKRRRKLT
jgi:hypothetical protein